MRKPSEQKVWGKCSSPFLEAQWINSLLSLEGCAQKCQTKVTAIAFLKNHKHYPSPMCTALNIYCITCTLSDSYLPLIIDFRLHTRAGPAAFCCALQPLLLWKCFPLATPQQPWGFVWTGGEEPEENKNPTQGWARGWGRAEWLLCPTAVGPEPFPSPRVDFCVVLWVAWDIGQGSSWQG